MYTAFVALSIVVVIGLAVLATIRSRKKGNLELLKIVKISNDTCAEWLKNITEMSNIENHFDKINRFADLSMEYAEYIDKMHSIFADLDTSGIYQKDLDHCLEIANIDVDKVNTAMVEFKKQLAIENEERRKLFSK